MTRNKGPRFTEDDLGFMQTVSSEVLAAVVRGELDLNLVARRELGSRGLDRHCRWVGFEKAARLAEQIPVRGANGRTVYITVPDDALEVPLRTVYVIRDNDGLYVSGLNADRPQVLLCGNVELAKRFRTSLRANLFLHQHAGAGYGLSVDAAIVPIQIR